MKTVLSVVALFVISSFNMNTIVQTEFEKQELLGKINYSENENFSVIPSEFTSKKGIYLRNEALDAFKKMFYSAKECGINLMIISASRNFDYQKGIWERKWKDGKFIKYFGADRAKAIMKYSSMPGTSRHHWGTDIDLNNLNDSYFLSGDGKKVYDWLSTHANSFGFYQTYTSKDSGRTGYEEEKWHWSYMPVAKQLLIDYNNSVTYDDISNFNGSESAENLKAIEKYVNGIDATLLQMK